VDGRTLRRFAWLLDEAFAIPGTNQRVGLDALLGLIPGVGDTLGALLSTYIIIEAARRGASPWTVSRMLGNVAVETIIGVIPIAGDLFDVVWKANLRNLDLLGATLARDEPPRDPRGVLRLAILLIAGAMLALVIGTALLTVALYRVLVG
jgi:Domain of unknown function (DUF4112)